MSRGVLRPFMGISIKILIFAALVSLTAVALRPLQILLLGRMENARDAFIGRAEEYSNRKILYGSMGPSIFGTLDIRDVKIIRGDDSVFLSVSRLRLSYSILELLRGNFRDSFKSVRIDRPVLNLDFIKDSDLKQRFVSLPVDAGAADSAPGFRELFPDNFSFRILNGEWEVTDSIGNFKLYGVRLDASVNRNKSSFKGRWNASLSAEREILRALYKSAGDAPHLEAQMSGRVSGEYSNDTGAGSAAVVIPSFAGNLFRFRPLNLSFLLSGTRLEVNNSASRQPADLSLVYDFAERKLAANLEAGSFSPSGILALAGPWRDFNPWLALRFSGNIGFERDAAGFLKYSVNIAGNLPENAYTGKATLAIDASGDSDHVNVDTMDIRSAFGDLFFRGGMDIARLAPYGSLSLSNFHLVQDPADYTGGISGDFYISTRGREISFFGENFTSGKVVLSAMDALVYREEEGLSFSLSALRFRDMAAGDSESYGNVRMSSISLDGSFDYEPRHVQATLKLDSFSVGDIIGLVEPLALLPSMPALSRSMAENLSVTTEVFFNTDYQHIVYNAPRFVAAYEGVWDVLAAASVSGTNSRFDLSGGRISWGRGNAEISASLDFSDLDDISFSLGAVQKEVSYFFDGMILDRRDISIAGSYGFQAYLRSGVTGIYSGYAQADSIPVPSGDGLASLSFLLSLLYSSPASWTADIDRFELSGLATPASESAVLSFSGAANEEGLYVKNLFFDDGRGALAGGVSLSWDPLFSFYRFRADINGSNRREYYGLNGVYRNSVLELSLSGMGMQFSRVSAHNAVADGNFRLVWESPEKFEAEAVLSALTVYDRDREIRASAAASLNSETLQLRQLNVLYSGLEASIPYLRIDRRSSRADTEIKIQGNFSGKPVHASMKAEARFDSGDTWFDMLKRPGSFSGSVAVSSAGYDVIDAAEPFGITFSGLREKHGIAINLSGGPRNMIRFRYSPGEDGSGSFYAAFSAPSPVRGSVTGSIDSKTIDAQSTDLYVDMGSLWRFIPETPHVAFPAGIVTADLRITGPLADPEFYGTARGTSVQIMVPEYLPEPIRPVPVDFIISGTEMSFGPVDAIVGKGGGIVSAWFRFEQWIPRIFNIDINVPSESPIPYSFDLSGIVAKGFASGKLTLAMEDMVFYINGDLEAQNAEISLNVSEMAAMEGQIANFDEGNIPAITDFSIRSGRRVEFFWPSVELPMLQANADMGSLIHVTSDAVSRRFSLTGDVKLRSGELFYLERNFYLREGTLFFRESETSFDPRISARAEIRDQADSGPVTISLIIDNAPLMSFTPRFVSNPPLSQLEIYSLLGQMPQNIAEGEAQRNLATSVAIDSLAQFALMRRLQREVRDFLGLDMFSIRTQVLQNVVLQATGLQANDPNVDRRYRVGNYFDNSTVFIGKYLGPAMFAQAMLSFRYDEKRVNMGGLRLEPEIGLEMHSPLIDVGFNISPLHPENLFIDDISFSVIWRRSF